MARMPGPGSKELRRYRKSRIGRLYLVTFLTHQRRPIFLDDTCARIAFEQIKLEHAYQHVFNYSWVIMPDHVHWIFGLRARSLSIQIGMYKSMVSKLAGIRIWQHGFHEKTLYPGRMLKAAIGYVVNNPVKAGLVGHSRDYRWVFPKIVPN